ncbi:Tyrosine-protein kinase Src42A [Holothuria leucospilota]|uniref:Tyrosine-protein kinase Src42A n=1 Tax=Holothuria leucospilota TaxID=206669 RepID=A0A9Q1H7D8_HOLLE|nr:Tyrosine-protein kinase Src42A [Holothuria leucospilota]
MADPVLVGIIVALAAVIVILVILLCRFGLRSRNSIDLKTGERQTYQRRREGRGSFRLVEESRRRLQRTVTTTMRRKREYLKESDPVYCRREVKTTDLLKSHGETEYWKGTFNNSTLGSQAFTVRGLKESTKIKDVIEFQRLAFILCSLSKHANIIETLAADTTKLPYYIYHETMEGVSLFDKLKENDENHYLKPVGRTPSMLTSQRGVKASSELEVLLKMSCEVTRGLSFLSSHKLFHPGINSKEVLLNANAVCKLYNFQTKATARRYIMYLITEEHRRLPWYAPETVCQHKYSSGSDIWSLGVLLFEIFSYAGVSYESLTSSELQTCYDDTRSYLPRPSGCTRSIYDIMTSCWHLDRRRRVTIDRVVSRLGNELHSFDKTERGKTARHRYQNIGLHNVQQH